MRLKLIGLPTAVLLCGGLLIAGTPADAQTKAGAKPAATGAAKAGAKPAAAKPAATGTAKAGPKVSPPKKAACGSPKSGLAEAAKKTEAKKAYEEAKKRFEKSDYDNSLACFKLADALVPGARPKYFIAQSLDRLGKAQEAVAAYDVFLKEAAPAGTPVADKFKDDVAAAKTRVEALKQSPGKIKVRVTPEGAPNLRFALDGGAVGSSEIAAPPGKHTVTVTADGYDRGTATVEIGFGETRETSITLNKTGAPNGTAEPAGTTTGPVASATAQASATGSIPDTTPPGGTEKKSNTLMTAGFIGLGVAVAGAVAVGAFGGIALSAKSDFNGGQFTRAKADEAQGNALIADILLVPSVAIGGTALVLLIVGATRSTPAKTGTTPSKKSATLPNGFIAPYATPTGAGAAALFTF